MSTLAIVGGGEFGRLVADLATSCGYTEFQCFDDSATRPSPHSLQDATYLGTLAELGPYLSENKGTHLAFAIGYKHRALRMELIRSYSSEAHFPTLIHPSAFVSPCAEVGEGSFIFSQANVELGASLGPFVSVFNQTSITHDVAVGANSFFSVGVSMGGRTTFGESCFVGLNATIVNDVTIGDRCTICAGTLLTKGLGSDKTVIGNPFKEISGVQL